VAEQLKKNSYGQYLKKILLELGSNPQPISLSVKR
jgi:glucose-1-phosphate thymidylyltransferase